MTHLGGRTRRALVVLAVTALMTTACGSVDAFETTSVSDAIAADREAEAADAGADNDPAISDPADNDEPTTTTSEPDAEQGDTTAATDSVEDSTDTSSPTTSDTAPEQSAPTTATVIEPRVIGSYPHDTAAFTQGLEFDENVLIESTGLYGESDRRRVNPGDGNVITTAALGDQEFGQGLTLHDGNLIQLTWKEGVAIVADPVTLEESGRLTFTGEGWGICSFGDRLVTSDGSDELQFRDPVSFSVISPLSVTLDGEPLSQLNELECIDGSIWATVWLTADIVQIDPVTGQVQTRMDASALVPDGLGPEDVLSGIALHRTARTLFITGKRWGVIYEVEFPS